MSSHSTPITDAPHPALFLHIQKTAGSSILQMARQQYGNSLTSHGDCWGHAPEKFVHTGFVSGHFGYDFARRLMPGRISFTFLRDPAERILSMYYFCRSRDPNEFIIYRRANQLDLRTFLEAGFTDPWVKKNIWNNQVWQLAHGYAHLDKRSMDSFAPDELLDMAKTHLGTLSHIGFTESITQDAQTIFASLGIRNVCPVPRINTVENRPSVEAQSADIRQLLDDLTCLDRQLYAYAFAKSGQK